MASEPTKLLSLGEDEIALVLAAASLGTTTARSPGTLALRSAHQTCRQLRDCAARASTLIVDLLGYDEMEDEDATDGAIPRPLVLRLHLEWAQSLPYIIPAGYGPDALEVLRTNFEHFQPILVRHFVAPDESALPEFVLLDEGDESGRPGAAEYANFRALLSAAVKTGAPKSTADLQQAIEGGWAEGYDRQGAEHFGHALVGKAGPEACIGAGDLLVGLWHCRVEAQIVELMGFQDGTQLAKTLFCMTDGLLRAAATRLPMHLQLTGCSSLIVGVMRGGKPQDDYLLLADPAEPGEVKPWSMSELSALGVHDAQVVVLRGAGQEDSTMQLGAQQFRNLLGQGSRTSTAATCVDGTWCFSTGLHGRAAPSKWLTDPLKAALWQSDAEAG